MASKFRWQTEFRFGVREVPALYKIQIYIFAHLNRSEFALFAKAASLKDFERRGETRRLTLSQEQIQEKARKLFG